MDDLTDEVSFGDLFGDLYDSHHLSIKLPRNAPAERADGGVAARQSLEPEFRRLEARLDKLVLMAQAMWTLLREKTDLTEADLLERVKELDARDGAADGRTTPPPVRCSKCDAMVCRKFNRCLFCGQEYAGGSAFDTA